MIDYTPVWPHGEIEEIFPDIFFVTGTNKTTYNSIDFQASRNMLVIREGQALTLINTVRLDDEGLMALDELGQVTHIVRLGALNTDPLNASYIALLASWISWLFLNLNRVVNIHENSVEYKIAVKESLSTLTAIERVHLQRAKIIKQFEELTK